MAEKSAVAPVFTRDTIKKLNGPSKEQLIMDMQKAQDFYRERVRDLETIGSDHEIEKNRMNHRHNIIGALIGGGVVDPDTLIESAKKIEDYMRGQYDTCLRKLADETARAKPPKVSTLIKS